MDRTPVFAAACAALMALLVPASAIAAKSKGAAARAKEEAGAAMEAGNTALAAGDVAGAIEAYAKAHELLPDATGPMVALGLAHEMNGDCTAAVPLLEDYAARKGDDARAEANAALGRCRAADLPETGPDPEPDGDPVETTPVGKTPVEPGPAKPPRAGKPVDPILIAGAAATAVGVIGAVVGIVFSARFHSARSDFVDATAPWRPDPDGPIVANLRAGTEAPVDLCTDEGRDALVGPGSNALADVTYLCGRMKSARAIGWAIGISGSVIAVAGVGLMVWSLTSKDSDAPAISLTPTPGGVFGSVRWTF